MTYPIDWREKTNFPCLASVDQDETAWPIGYSILQGQAGTGQTLNVGDAVFIDSAGNLSKSNTAANYLTFAGIVVGGQSVPTSNSVAFGSNTLGTLCATAGQWVFVAYLGIVWALSDAAIVVGTRVGQGATTAGRVDDGAASNFFGTALNAAAGAAVPVKILLMPAGRAA